MSLLRVCCSTAGGFVKRGLFLESTYPGECLFNACVPNMRLLTLLTSRNVTYVTLIFIIFNLLYIDYWESWVLRTATDLLKHCTAVSTAYHRTAGYASGGVTKDKEPLKKAKTPQGRFDMDENEPKSNDVLKSKNTRQLCYTVIWSLNKLHKGLRA